MFGSILTGNALSVIRDGFADGTGDGVETVERALWLVVLASVALDVYTTSLGLSMGLSEGNPAMRAAIDGFGFGALAAAKLVVVAGAALLRTLRPEYGTAIALGLALPWTATVLVNAVVLTTV